MVREQLSVVNEHTFVGGIYPRLGQEVKRAGVLQNSIVVKAIGLIQHRLFVALKRSRDAPSVDADMDAALVLRQPRVG